MDLIAQLAKELSLRPTQVANTVKLFDEGNTVPFIARYRKEMTGELDEVVLRELEDRLKYLRALTARQEEVIRLIGEQGKLTPKLEAKIRAATVLQEVEDLYLPFKPKRRTRATIAREKGLAPLAETVMAQELTSGTFAEVAAPFVDPERGVATVEEAMAGALDICAETISDDAAVRKAVRERTRAEGRLVVTAVDPEKPSNYTMYYEYEEPIARIAAHRVLAVNRGEREEFLRVKIEVDQGAILSDIAARVITNWNSIFVSALQQTIADAYDRLIAPSIEREVRAELTVDAEERAIKVFGQNLKPLLLQPPARGLRVLGIDPAYRTGCKVAVIDETGKLLATDVIYPTPPQNNVAQAAAILKSLVKRFGVTLIAIGNGTASRETELFVADLLKELPGVAYYIVSEAGASVYSASKVAGEEFPDLDVSIRGAISIARRVLDPLAELVKIDPKAIGVGQYQHDVNQTRLAETLRGVVEDCVNSVGVDLNTASASLLGYVAGINSAVAKNIVAHREVKGKFAARGQLLAVPRLGEATFTQCAGFLRIPDASDPFDNTSIHPESYDLAERLLARSGLAKADLTTRDGLARVRDRLRPLAADQRTLAQTAAELGAGVPTLRDIVDALMRPGRDPRDELPKPIFRTDVLKIEDLKPGMVLKGTVRNVVDFGVFVDLGVKHDGLIHRSELADRSFRHPLDVVRVGDVIDVRVLSVDLERQRIALSRRGLGASRAEV